MTQDRIRRLLDYCDREHLWVSTAIGYSEPGYADPEAGIILLADWNDRSRYENGKRVITDDRMPRLAKLSEKLGAAIEWEDEWVICKCGKAFRCKPDSYCWTMSGYIGDGYCLCRDCLADDPSPLLEEAEGNPRHALTSDQGVHPEDHDYVLLESGFQNGFYGGQSADPQTIGRSLDTLGITRYVFYIDGVGQFDTDFSVYVHREDIRDFVHRTKQPLSVIWRSVQKHGRDPAVAMREALADASRKMASLPNGPGVKYAECHSDGTATVRLVSPEEFIGGIGK